MVDGSSKLLEHDQHKVLLFLCFLQANQPAVSIDGHEDVPHNNENALLKAVANQPVSVAIDAGGSDFQFYSEVN
jgi:hypothetical protein